MVKPIEPEFLFTNVTLLKFHTEIIINIYILLIISTATAI